jgi:hypothetical protein
LTSIELDFSKLDTDGILHMFLSETDSTGAPVFDKVLAYVDRDPKTMAAGYNKFTLPPSYLPAGKRYAWYVVTTGNHQLRGTDGSKFTAGTSFHATDGSWAQGDLLFDFNMRINGARFANARTVIPFKPMTLDNGMYPNFLPPGTAIAWEIRPDGLTEWSRLPTPDDLAPLDLPNPLNGLPALVELRCTILATADLAPMIELSADAQIRTGRVRADMRAVTKRIVLGLTTTQIQTLIALGDFDPVVHTFSPRIMVNDGPALIAPDTSTTTVDAVTGRRLVLSIYTVPSGTSVVRAAPGTTTNNVVDVPYLENVSLFAI